MKAMLLLLAIAAAVPAGVAGGCASSLDCSLNGNCIAGRCACDVGWRGPGCAALALAPQTPAAMLNESAMSTWGAPAVFAEGAYHAYVSEMLDACGITSWRSNSQLTHYVARSPGGPWRRADVAVPVWAHCATAAVVPNASGTTIIMTHMSGKATPRRCLPSGCCTSGASPCGMKHPCNATRPATRPATPAASVAAAAAAAGTAGTAAAAAEVEAEAAAAAWRGPEVHADGRLPIKYAHSPRGPWMETTVEVRNLSRFFLAAPLVLPNGTAFMVVETAPLSTLLRAPSWRGPYDVVTRAACGGGEGASIWADKAGRGLHCFYHRGGGAQGMSFNDTSEDGGHSFSVDGVNWYCARKGDGRHAACGKDSIPMYGSTIAFASGERIAYGTRERPHAITGEDGALVAVSSSLQLCAPLSTGWVRPGPYSACANQWPGFGDRTWTSILPVRAGATRQQVQQAASVSFD
jgi:hypothetical protein